MKEIYVEEIGKYFTVELTDDMQVIKIPFDINPINNPSISDDIKEELLLYLELHEKYPSLFAFDDITKVLEGIDLNLDNYVKVVCTYSPFVHFIYLPGNWII